MAGRGFDEQFNTGRQCASLGRLEQAASHLTAALRLAPDHAEALTCLGSVRLNQGRPADAVVLYEQALAIDPRDPILQFNLGVAYHVLQDDEKAVTHFQRALEFDPRHVDARVNLGTIAMNDGRVDDAVDCYRHAIQFAPDHALAHFNLATALLLLGDFEQGWQEYEWRWKGKQKLPELGNVPLWSGARQTHPSDLTILIHAEQGLGDTLQFVRYVPLVKTCASRVVLVCQPPLERLLSPCRGIDEVVASGKPISMPDAHLPLLSLPRVFETNVNTIPNDVPYLSADAELAGTWRERLQRYPGFRVGIFWAGSPTYAKVAERTLPLTAFEQLARIPGVRLLSLQKGVGAQQLADLEDSCPIVDFEPELDEASGPFMDTAAIMSNLDLVIGCDSSLIHLAGALGVRAWLALPRVPTWRWMLEGDTTPWYPTLRLFRQTRRNDWSDVFERMARSLRELASGGGAF